MLPLGFLLTMYTITGYDASAHVSEETHGAEDSAPKGVWRSVFYSAVVGWIVLLAITFAIQKSHEAEIYKAGFPALTIFTTALSSSAAKAVILISTVGQLFCGMACVTSASRMTFAFSRDGAVPGHNLWRRLGKNRTPTWAVFFVVPVRPDHHDPGVLPEPPRHAGGVPRGHLDLGDRPLHRLHDPRVPALAHGRAASRRARGRSGNKYKWINPIAFVWVAICVVIFCLPFAPEGVLFGKRLQLVGGQLRADRHDRGDARRHDLVRGLGEKHVQGPDPHDRRARRRKSPARDRPGPVGRCGAAAPLGQHDAAAER